MPLEEFLLPKESIRYTGTEEVEYEESTYNLFITNIRLILYSRKGLVLRKERIVSERLTEIQDVHYSARVKGLEMNKGILTVETSKKKLDMTGTRDNIKQVSEELKKYIELANVEARERASLYMEKTFLAHNEAFAWNLTRRVKEKANKCCVCGNEDVRIWLLDWIYDPSRETSLIFARLFCREHEKKWKEGEMMNYRRINGLLILDRHLNPMDMLINMIWGKFTNKIAKDELTLQTLLDYLTKTTRLAYKGSIDEFLERVTRAQEFLPKEKQER